MGLFEVTYVCSCDDRDFKTRKHFLDVYYRAHTTTPPEDQIMWWGSVTEAPEEVLEYLFFLKENKRWKNLRKAFKDIDGPGGNGVVNLREFEESIVEMNCTKFKGPDE